MYKRIFVLTLIFMAVVFLSIMAMPALIFFVIAGSIICVYAKLKSKPGGSLLLQSGLVVLITPIVTYSIVLAAMSGVFGA